MQAGTFDGHLDTWRCHINVTLGLHNIWLSTLFGHVGA